MEGKKKFEKPQMEVVQLKPAGMVCGTSCGSDCFAHCGSECGSWDGDCWE